MKDLALYCATTQQIIRLHRGEPWHSLCTDSETLELHSGTKGAPLKILEGMNDKALGMSSAVLVSYFIVLASKGALMSNRLAKELAAVLRRKRSSLLLQEIAGSQNDTERTLDDRESELEESAQKDRMTRLDSCLTERGQFCCARSTMLWNEWMRELLAV